MKINFMATLFVDSSITRSGATIGRPLFRSYIFLGRATKHHAKSGGLPYITRSINIKNQSISESALSAASPARYCFR